MDFDYTTETIQVDSTTILTIGGTGALELPVGTTAQQPGTAIAGAIRYNSTVPQLEMYTGAAWVSFNGSVTSISGSGGTTGLTLSGGPITTSGTLTLGGTLALANGGTNAALTASAGSVTYSTASALALSAVGTSGYLLASGGAGAPTWTNSPTVSGANITSATIPNSALVNSSITIGTTAIALGATSTTLGGMTGITFTSGTVTGVANPVAATDVVNLQYLQAFEAGLEWKVEAVVATTADLSGGGGGGNSNNGTVTYANGPGTITSGANIALQIDGVTVSTLGTRVLVKNETAGTSPTYIANGIYTLTTAGSGAVAWVLTRAIDANTSNSLNNATLYVTTGTTNTNTGWTQTAANPTVGTTGITFVQNSGMGTYTAGTGLTLTGNTFSLTSPVSLTNGGTNASLTAVNGGIVYSSGTAMAISAAGTSGQILTSAGAATPTWTTLSTVAVTSVTGTANQITTSGATGAITLSVPATFIAPGTLSFVTQFISSIETLSAAGATQGTATAITKSISNITTVAAGTGVILPTATGNGEIHTINNNGANALLIYPQVGGTIDGGTVNASVSVPVSETISFFATGTNWVTWNDVHYAGTGISVGYIAGGVSITNTGVTSNVAGTGISVSGATGAVTINNTGVTSITGTANQITASSATGGVTLSLPAAVTIGTSLTVSGLTANSFLYSGTAGLLTTTTAPTNGQLLIGSTGAAPVAATLTAGANISITNAAGSITIAGPKLYAENPSSPTTPSATGTNAIALGNASVASHYGQVAASAGAFVGAGDAQNSTYTLRISTTNATPAIAYLDGVSAKITLPSGSAYMVDADIVAISTAGTTANGAWNLRGLFTNLAGTVALVGSESRTFIAGTALSAASISMTADTVNSAIQFNVTGNAATTIRWVITCRTTEVTTA